MSEEKSERLTDSQRVMAAERYLGRELRNARDLQYQLVKQDQCRIGFGATGPVSPSMDAASVERARLIVVLEGALRALREGSG